jgi:tetratricopeptide (TPR) repeat protein
LSLTSAEIKWDRADIKGMYDLASEAITLLVHLPPSNSSTLEAQHLLARSTGLIALYYSSAMTEADPHKALEYYQKALSQLEPFEKPFEQTKMGGADWRWLRSLAGIQQGMGDLLLTKFGKVHEANQYYEAFIATWKRLRALRSGDPEVAFGMAWAANKFGDVLLGQGHDDVALSRFEEAREGIRQLGDELSTHPGRRTDLSIVQNNIGMILRSQQRYEQAIKSFQEAKGEVGRALERDPDRSHWLSVQAWTNDNLGQTRVRWARAEKNATLLSGADDELNHALQDRLALAKRAKERARWQIEAAISRANIAALDGTRRGLTKDCIGAARDFRRAAEINPEVKDDEREDDMTLRKLDFQEWAGVAFRGAGKRDEAEHELKGALETVSRATPKYGGKRKKFDAIKERLEQDLREIARYEPGACFN